MKKLALIASLLLLGSPALAVEAVIDPGNPDELVLDSGNSWDKSKTFDGSKSSGQGSLSYSWDIEETSDTASGVEASFTFDRDSPQTNTIKLTVSNGTHSDTVDTTQTLRDAPEVSEQAGSSLEDVNITDGEETKTYSTSDFSITNTFDDPVSYSWDINAVDSSNDKTGSGSSIDFTFSNEGDVDVKLTVTDDAGKSGSDTITVTVSNATDSSNDNNDENNNKKDNQDNEESSPKGLSTVSEKQEEAFEHVKEVLVEAGNSEAIGIGTALEAVEISASELIVGDLKVNVETGSPVAQAPKGVAYRYFEIEKSGFNDSQVNSVRFDFSVRKSWLSDNNIRRDTVVLERYTNSWEALQTSETGENSSHVKFEASSPGFSSFAVTGEKKKVADLEIVDLNLNTGSVGKDENFRILVKARNTGGVEGSLNVEASVANQTLSRQVTLAPNETKVVGFNTSISKEGSYTVKAGTERVQLQVGDTGGTDGLPVMLIAGFVGLIVVTAGGVLLYVEEEEEFQELIDDFKQRLNGEKDESGFSFSDTFGDDEDSGEDFDYEFDWEE